MVENTLLRELANGSLLVLDVAITFILIRYVWTEVYLKSKSYWDMIFNRTRSIEAQMVLAFCVIHFGTAIRDTYNWITYKAISAHWDIGDTWIQSQPMILTALFVTGIGSLCALRIFARRRWTWIVVGFIAAILPFLMHVYFLESTSKDAVHGSAAGDCHVAGVTGRLGNILRGCR